ncbi:hypothetical protein [Synechococcus sp. CS-1332]|uniref:hypothetical protein n=1 Tax=Synechococcus sp. CS-1332 TaxID=2847972 RepID=UPI00223B494E|nr:hypothetical protein [Synechococcus sp. CS-1332]MCT0208661.1 hypothetical protein [Synechococcus sp. CS-1332]
MLSRTYLTALHVAFRADYDRMDWVSALARLETSLQVKQALGRSAEDIGGTRFNRASTLIALNRLDEAQEELVACLELFTNDPSMTSKVRGSLAALFQNLGDTEQAIRQACQALAITEHLQDPESRAISHGSLAIYLLDARDEQASRESARHQLAALLYRHCAGLNQGLQNSLVNYVKIFRQAEVVGSALVVPRVAELLADPAFGPLVEWLTQLQVDLAELQQRTDQILEQCRQQALAGN